jgi:heme-degrading monooxygenase HmoA
MLVFICTAAYGQVEEGASPSATFQFDHDQLLSRFANLKPFKPGRDERELGYAFVVTQEDFKNSLIFLPKEKIDEVMEGFVRAVAFSFKGNTQFLMLTQWKDREAAQDFIKVEDKSWRLKDEKYKQYIKKVEYKEIDVAKDERALLTRKTIEQARQRHDATTFVSARGNYLFECTLVENYKDKEVKKLILQIWEIIESEEKKGAR